MIDLVAPVSPLIVTSPFGRRRNPLTGDEQALHPGVDMRAAVGQHVVAAADGIVRRSYLSVRGPDLPGTKTPKWWSYGETIVIAHSGCSTRYAHLSRRLVKEGDVVKAGQVIGHAGSTGDSSGPHLHFELVVDSKPVDPLPHFSLVAKEQS
jgi:murein DD-endopeptidase MepM/ murein hydrolase activator NlpD